MKTQKLFLYPALFIYLVVAYFWPIVGLAALICMLAPVIWAVFQGRVWCGNYCPRGNFYNLFKTHTIPPKWLISRITRIAVLAVIMTVFVVRLVLSWPDAAAIGRIFWQMVLITTIVGAYLATRYSARTWCMICPMGTLAAAVSPQQGPQIVPSGRCVSCQKCTKVCPMHLPIHEYAKAGRAVDESDCIKCGDCVTACPLNTLSLTRQGEGKKISVASD